MTAETAPGGDLEHVLHHCARHNRQRRTPQVSAENVDLVAVEQIVGVAKPWKVKSTDTV